MAYQEIIAPATPAAVIDAVATFAAANGWTVHRNTLSGANRTLTVSRAGTDYIHLYNLDANNIYIRGSIDYAVGTTPDLSGRRSTRATTNLGAGPYTKLFMFADSLPSPHVHLVIEANTAGKFWHISFGLIDKLEPFTGGTYVDGTNWQPEGSSGAQTYTSNSYPLFGNNYSVYTTSAPVGGLRADVPADSRVDTWFQPNDAPTNDTNLQLATDVHYAPGGSQYGSASYKMRYCDDNIFSNRSVFHTISASISRIGGYHSPVGVFPNIRLCNTNKFTDGQEITIGSDVWKVFPFLRKGLGSAPTYLQYSDMFGFAYKKVP